MSDNPYSPPTAPVTDFEPPGSIERPLVVTRAVYLLWASFVLTLPGLVHFMFEPDPELSQSAMLVIGSIGVAITAAFAIWLNGAAWKGKGYARWVLAVLNVLGLAGILWFEFAYPEEPPVPWYIEVTNALSWLTALPGNGMLFAPAANAWYREMQRWR